VILINSIKDTIYIRLKFVIPSWVVQMISFLIQDSEIRQDIFCSLWMKMP